MSIAFIVTKNHPQQVLEVRTNPDGENLKVLNEICEARGIENHMVIYLTNAQYYNLAYWMR